jgi:hypothetical protein
MESIVHGDDATRPGPTVPPLVRQVEPLPTSHTTQGRWCFPRRSAPWSNVTLDTAVQALDVGESL